MAEKVDLAAGTLLVQPQISGTGSATRYDNPWPEWKVVTFTVHLSLLLLNSV